MRLVALSLLCAVTAYGQTPIYQGVLQSDLNAAGFKILSANLSDYAGANMTWNAVTGKFDASVTGGGGTGTVTSITATTPIIITPSPLVATGVVSLDATSKSNWDTAFTDRLKWDGGATGLVAATGRTSLGLVIGTNVEAWDVDLDNLAAITGNSKFAFRNSSGIWQARGLGTNLTDDGTNINAAGGGGGTPGGANTNVQINDSGAFYGDAGLAYVKATHVLSVSGQYLGPVGTNTNPTYSFTGDTSTGIYEFASGGPLLMAIAGSRYWRLDASGQPQMAVGASQIIGWTSGADVFSATDTAFFRNAAGVVEINNGTPGTYRDILTRGLISSPVAFASRIGSPTEGTQQAFTDSSTNVSGATITGGGSNHILGYYNGTNWIVDSGSGAGGGVTSLTGTAPIVVSPTTGASVASLNVGVDHAFTAAQSMTLSDAGTTTAPDLLTLGHNTSGTAAATFGTSLLFNAQDSTTAGVNAGEIQSKWTTATHNSNVSDMLFRLDNGSTALATAATIHGAGYVDAAAGFQIGAAAASGKILIGDGTKYVASTPTYPTGAAANNKVMVGDGTNWIVSTPTFPFQAVAPAGKILIGAGSNWIASTPTYPNTAPTAGYKLTGDGTNFAAYPTDLVASSTATVSAGYSADTYLAGSLITVAAGDFKVSGQYHCVFDMTKTGAGVATPIISVRVGTAGTTADTAVCTLTFSAGTAVIDSGMFEVYVNFRSVGSGTSAVFQAIGTIQHQNGVTGLVSKNSDYAASTSAGFATNTFTKIGLSFNGGSSFAGTNLLAQAQLLQP